MEDCFAILMFFTSLIYGGIRIWSDPAMRKNILEAVEILKG